MNPDYDAAFAALRRERPADAVFAAVRSRVRSQIEARAHRRKFCFAAFTAFTAAAAGCGLLLSIPRQQIEAPRPTLAAVVREPLPVIEAASPLRRRRPARTSAGPVVMKMLTNDPDVVIYWIGNSGGKQ